MTALLRVARNVTDLARAQAFYTSALGFTPLGTVTEDAELAKLLGVSRVRGLHMGRGAQQIELTECHPAGAPYPADAGANALCFQHIALVTEDMTAAFAGATQAGARPISTDGPQTLPVSSGGVAAWKFRDPDGHPLEFLQFPAGHLPGIGYDHSAISVADATRSIEFYTAIGLSLKQRQVNRGLAQDRLDGLSGAIAEVIAMASPSGPPHLELLAYRSPKPQPGAPPQPNDIVADRLVFSDTAKASSLAHDPDGHILLREGRSRDPAG